MWRYVQEIVQGAFERGLNVPTFWFLNGCLVALVLLCAAIVFLSDGSTEFNLSFHFSVMAVLAILLGLSLNFVIKQANILKEQDSEEGEKKSE